LLEVLVASVVASVVAVGTAAAFVTASRMTRERNNPTFAEASVHAQQTLDQFRNQLACDNAAWFNPANCQVVLPAGLPPTWTSAGEGLPNTGPGMLANDFPGAKRCYRVTRVLNCGGGALVPDCLRVEVRVCWTDVVNCPC